MKKSIKLIGVVILAAAVALAACNPGPPQSPTPTLQDPRPVLTGAAQTAQARLTEMAQVTPSPLPATPTDTPAPPSATPEATPSVEATLEPTATQAVQSGGDRAVFVRDVTVDDGTDFAPGTAFVKTWRVMNTGTTTWSTSYALVFVSDNAMGGPASIALPMEVAPNQSVDISVNLVAPNTAGHYRGYWRLRNSASQFFGDSIYVDIDVVGSGTAVATATSTTTSSSTVSDVLLTIDNPTVAGACPHTYNLAGNFTLSQSATVTYQLLAGSDTPGFEFNLPGPTTATFTAGTHTLNFSLSISNSGNGWIQLYVTAPQTLASPQAGFSLTCQ